MLKIIAISCLLYTIAYGMDCSLGTSNNVFEKKLLNSCPGLLDSSDNEYCCPNGDSFSCCNLSDFIIQWLMKAWPIILFVLLATAIVSCVCFCFSRVFC